MLPIVALVLGATAAFGLVSCGGRDEEGLLPGDTARQILDNLDQVQADVAIGDCSSAAGEVEKIQEQINGLRGSSVDTRLRSHLEDGVKKLADEVNAPGACETTTEETVTEEPTTTEETTTEKTTTEKEKTDTTTVPTIPTTTQPTTTTTTQTTPTTPPTGGTPGSGGVGSGGPG